MSSEYENISDSTVTEKNFITHSSAECEAYKLSLPSFSTDINLSADFIAGVKQSVKGNSWTQFMNYFGSHYVDTVVLGGRVVQEHRYS